MCLCITVVLQDVPGWVRRHLYVRVGCIRMVLQFLTGEKIRYKLCLGCIRMLLQYLRGKKTIIDALRVHTDGTSISHG